MSYQSMMLSIDTKLATIDFDSARIAFMNTTYVPKAGVPYLVATMTSLTSKAVTLGADQASGIGGSGYTSQWDGTYQVEAVWPENAGRDGIYQMQQKLLRLFYRGLTLVTSDSLLIYFDSSSPLPVRPDGAWARGPVSCPWWCQETT